MGANSHHSPVPLWVHFASGMGANSHPKHYFKQILCLSGMDDLIYLFVNALSSINGVVRDSRRAAARIELLDDVPAARDLANVGRHLASQARARRELVTDIRTIWRRVRARCALSVIRIASGEGTGEAAVGRPSAHFGRRRNAIVTVCATTKGT